jgi:glutathione peroxidase
MHTTTPLRTTHRLSLLTALWLAMGAVQAQTAAPPANTTRAACPALLNHRFDRLQDEKPQDLCQYAGRVVLVVNTASFCGFTSQYKGLEALHRRLQPRGLVVLGFPANDFGRQEPGSNQAIADFCENTFGVQFPMFTKTSVVGAGANPLYRQLAARTGQAPQWNFHKYLIDRSGQVVRSFPSTTEPDDPAFMRELMKMMQDK